MDDIRAACLGFSSCGGIGPATFQRLSERYPNICDVFYLEEKKLANLLTEKQLYQFIAFRKSYNFKHEQLTLERSDVWFLTQFDADYPRRLKEIKDPPICLFGRGDRERFSDDDLYIAVVGTRKPTAYGEDVGSWCGGLYAEHGHVVVSGLAYGVDSIAQASAITKGGRTIAVLGTNIVTPYPSQNEDLYEQIIKKSGIVVSEYPPGFFIHKGMFVLRNRIIVGLSDYVVVVEGGEKSGTLTTARYAAEYGRDVFAVPGQITSDMSVGPNLLIQEGASVLRHPLDVFGFDKTNRAEMVVKQLNEEVIDGLGEDEKKIYTILSSQTMSADGISRKLSYSSSAVLSLLSILEVKGIVQRGVDGMYAKAE